MTNLLHTSNEVGRLIALNELLILNTPTEDRFDRIVEYAASHFDMPIVAIHLIGKESTWCKSVKGLPHGTVFPGEVAFCSHAILQSEILVVENALLDMRFQNNPIVTGFPNIVFYAGAPIKLPSGLAVGALCLIDSKPRQLNKNDLNLLGCLRNMVETELSHLDEIHSESKYQTSPTTELFKFVELLSRQDLHGALTYLNSRTPHRYTAIYEFNGKVLKNVCLVDKYDSKVTKGEDPLFTNTYCSRLPTSNTLNMLSHIPEDYPRVASTVEAYGGVLICDPRGVPFGSLCHFDFKRCEVNINDIPLLKKVAPLIYKYLQSSVEF